MGSFNSTPRIQVLDLRDCVTSKEIDTPAPCSICGVEDNYNPCLSCLLDKGIFLKSRDFVHED